MIAQVTRTRCKTRSTFGFQAEERLCTLSDARKLAAILRQRETYTIWGRAVQEVLLFGSVARDYVGADLDLVLVVPEVWFQEYVELAGIWCGYGPRKIVLYRERRFEAATHALCLYGNYQVSGHSEMEWNSHYIDLHVFPTDWRDRLGELQLRLGHHDPKFMENVAREAIRI